MEKRSGLSELSVISWVSAVEGRPLSGVPLYWDIGLRRCMSVIGVSVSEELICETLCTQAFEILDVPRFSEVQHKDGETIGTFRIVVGVRR